MDEELRYKSHLEVLQTQPKNIGTILEFGAGHSTECFLDDAFYPNLRLLVTCETKGIWIDTSNRPEKHIILMGSEAQLIGQVQNIPQHIPQQWFDLVFVDGLSRDMRFPTAVAASNLSNRVIVHDTEKACYDPIFEYFHSLGWVWDTYKPEPGTTDGLPYTTTFLKKYP